MKRGACVFVNKDVPRVVSEDSAYKFYLLRISC
jgi:hypothetical protein